MSEAKLFTFPNPALMPKPHRCILHWTAGTYESTFHDQERYHALVEWVDGRIRVVAGVPIINNLHSLTIESPTYDEHPTGYAAHTRRMNSWSIGYSICAMWNATPEDHGDYPMLPEQVDGLITLCAQTASVFGMPVDEDHFFTHWEAEYIHGIEQQSKWDIIWVPNAPELDPRDVGPWLRERIAERI